MLLRVHNAGDPISQELLPDLFKPMKCGRGKMLKDSRSIGLGLYIVQQIILAHDGVIEVSSSKEEGTTFTVRVPRKAHAETIELKERVGPTIQSNSSERDQEEGVLH
jgi:nitrogen-specific signal transduction histidine kinase